MMKMVSTRRFIVYQMKQLCATQQWTEQSLEFIRTERVLIRSISDKIRQYISQGQIMAYG